MDGPNPTGFLIAGGAGLAATVGGIAWLLNTNARRDELDRRIRAMSGIAFVLPTYDPTTKTAAFMFSQRF